MLTLPSRSAIRAIFVLDITIKIGGYVMRAGAILPVIFLMATFALGATPAFGYQVSVTYSNLSTSGPVSLGLQSVPDEATVVCGIGTSPGLCGIGTSPGVFVCDEQDIQTAALDLGDLGLDETNLNNIAMEFTHVPRTGDFKVTGLSYDFFAVDTATGTNVIVFQNSFQLTISGVDNAVGQIFIYDWADNTQMISLPEPGTLSLLTIGLTGIAWV